jgi:hypothetical protein
VDHIHNSWPNACIRFDHLPDCYQVSAKSKIGNCESKRLMADFWGAFVIVNQNSEMIAQDWYLFSAMEMQC